MSEEKEMYERIDESPQFDGSVRDSHEVRYYMARGFVEPEDIVLDAGCGIGYGMRILKKAAKQVIGLDRNPRGDQYPEGIKTIYYDFEKKYKPELVPESLIEEFDVFVGLESIEHLDGVGVDNYRTLAHKAKKWIIVSTPIIPNSNAFHKQQFTQEIMERMFVNSEWRHYQTFKQNDAYGIFIFKRV